MTTRTRTDYTERASADERRLHAQRSAFCWSCGKVGTHWYWGSYRERLGMVEVYECEHCGQRHRYVVSA